MMYFQHNVRSIKNHRNLDFFFLWMFCVCVCVFSILTGVLCVCECFVYLFVLYVLWLEWACGVMFVVQLLAAECFKFVLAHTRILVHSNLLSQYTHILVHIYTQICSHTYTHWYTQCRSHIHTNITQTRIRTFKRMKHGCGYSYKLSLLQIVQWHHAEISSARLQKFVELTSRQPTCSIHNTFTPTHHEIYTLHTCTMYGNEIENKTWCKHSACTMHSKYTMKEN
jgi:hypothetical protein